MNENQNASTWLLILLLGSLSCFSSAKDIELGTTTYSQTLLSVGAGQPSIETCDFNADGNLDVIITNYSDDNIVTYQGNGKGKLIEVGRFPAGENPTNITTSDINDDGHVDVIVANHETSYVSMLFGDGTGRFKQTPESTFVIDVKPHPHVVRLHDIDGDNKADLIVDSRNHKGLLVLRGLANGGFELPGKIIDVGGDPYRGFAINDINGDGQLDVVTPNRREIGIAINSNTDDMSFSLRKLAQSESPFAVELADMNGDQKIDLVIATNGTSISIIPGDGHGNFIEGKKTTIDTTSGAKQIAIGDINGDGISDSLISHWSGKVLAVLGSKTAIQTIGFEHSDIPNPWGVAFADLNADGKSDFIIADGDSELAVVFVSQR